MELVAPAQAQAEKRAASAPQDGPVSQEMAKNIAALKAGFNSALLAGANGIESAWFDDPAAKVRRANLEAVIQSDRFGNLSGQMRGSRPGRVMKALEAEELAANLKSDRNNVRPLKMLSSEEADQMAYGLFSPLRGGESAALNHLGPDDDYWLNDPLKQPYKTRADWSDDSPPMASGQA